MKKQRPRVYFDRKAGVAKICATARGADPQGPREEAHHLEWHCNSSTSWEAFVEQWEHRNTSR